MANSLPGLIAKQPFFKGLEKSQYETLAELAMVKDFKAGETIFQEGDPANRFYLILEGRVMLRYESKEHVGVPTQILGAGDDLGWSWLFPPYYFFATAEAMDPVNTIFFYGTRLRQCCEQDHDLGYEVMKRIAQTAIKHLNVARRNPEGVKPKDRPASLPPVKRK